MSENTKIILDNQKQVEYWLNCAKEDLTSAKILLERNRILHAFFFCHLVIEKAIKAHIVRYTGEFAQGPIIYCFYLRRLNW